MCLQQKQVSCAALLEVQSKFLIPTSIANRELTNICNLPSATRIHCSVEAYNSIGKSEPTSGSIFTQLKLQNVKTQHLQVQAVSKKDATVKIVIRKVQVDKGDVSSYFVLVEKLSQHSISKKSTVQPACSVETIVENQSGNVESAEKCYLAAKLSADEMGQEYVFTIGDDQNYRGFHNKPLEQGAEYNVYLGLQAAVKNGSVKLSKLLAPVSFDFLPAKCPPPPAIKGAAASLNGTATAEQTVFYACTTGFVKVRGEVQLTCQRGNNDEYDWHGTPLICSKGVWEGFGSAIGFLFLALVLSTGFFIFKWKRAAKKQNPQVCENVAGFDGNGEQSQDQETTFNNVYDTVKDEPPKSTPEYEAVDMQAVGTDHIYASTQ